MRNITFFQLGYFYNMCGSKKWVDTGARRRGSPICCEVMIMMIMMMMMMMTMTMIMISWNTGCWFKGKCGMNTDKNVM